MPNTLPVPLQLSQSRASGAQAIAALAYDRASKGQSPIVASDFCRPMLAIGGKTIPYTATAGTLPIRGDDGMLGIDFEVFDSLGKLVATFAKGVA